MHTFKLSWWVNVSGKFAKCDSDISLYNSVGVNVQIVTLLGNLKLNFWDMYSVHRVSIGCPEKFFEMFATHAKNRKFWGYV